MRKTRLLVIAAALLLVTACAGLPHSGDVQRASDPAVGESDLVTYEPAPAAPGAEPTEVAAGFFDAMLAYPVSSATARSYLTQGAGNTWSAGSQVSIYRSQSIRTRTATEERASIEVALEQSGTLDPSGHYTPDRRTVVHELDVTREDGEWRISDPPPGIAVTQAYFDTYYQAFDVYLFDLDGERFVTDPVHLQTGERLATSLTSALVAGKPARVAEETRTYVPGSESWNPAVTISDGRALVEFDISLTTLDAEVRRRLSAQVVRTLAQVPDLETVQLVGTDGPLVVDGQADQPITDWEEFEPEASPAQVAGVVDGAVVTFDGAIARPVDAIPEELAADAQLVAFSSANAWAVAGSDHVVRVGRAGQQASWNVSGTVVAMSWDSAQNLWVSERSAGRLQVRVIADGATVVQLPDRLGGATSFALDPSSRRYAVTLDDGDVAVGFVSRVDTGISLSEPVTIAPDVGSASSVQWLTQTEVAVVGDGETGRQVYRAVIDGSLSDASAGTSPRLPNVAVRRLAVNMGDDEPELYVGDDRDRLWYLGPSGSWRLSGLTVRALSGGR